MQIIEQSWQWEQKPINVLKTIERIGRVCYKSEDKITDNSAKRFVEMIVKRGHESVLEHVSASVRFITNRGVTHELVRHRLASFSQESTRYVKYDGNMEFIRPVWWADWETEKQKLWMEALQICELRYRDLIKLGCKPQEAREVLPNSLKTEIVMTANLREWRHVFSLRCSSAAHPQIRELMISLREDFRKEIPIIFEGTND